MKSLVIIVAVAVTVGATRPSRSFDTSEYRDGPPFFDSPPPSFLRQAESFADDSSIFSEPPPDSPSYRGGRIFFHPPPPLGSSYYPFHKPKSFYQDVFSADAPSTKAKDYHGPPPPALSPGEDSRKPASSSAARDERPPGSLVEQSATKVHGEPRGQQQQQQHQHQHHHQQQPTRIETRQPLSFGGHSSHLSYGDHSLGFASVTASDINPLAASLNPSTRASAATATVSSSISSMQPSSNSYQPHNTPPHPPPPEMQTSAPMLLLPSSSSKITSNQPSANVVARLTSPESSTPVPTMRLMSVPLKSGLDPVQNALNQIASLPSLVMQQNPKSYEYRTITQGQPSAAHGQLPIEDSKQQFQIPDLKNNFLIYDTKSSFPFGQFTQQSDSSSSGGGSSGNDNNNNNVTPVRFNIPTAPIMSALTPQASAPIKIAIQGVDFSRAPITFTAVPANTNNIAPEQNQADATQLNKLNSESNTATNTPSYYIVPNAEQSKSGAQASSGIPLGSFYVLNEQAKKALQAASNVPSGLQLQLGGLSGLEYFGSSGNSDQISSASSDVAKLSLDLQVQPAVSYPKIAYQHQYHQQQPNRW